MKQKNNVTLHFREIAGFKMHTYDGNSNNLGVPAHLQTWGAIYPEPSRCCATPIITPGQTTDRHRRAFYCQESHVVTVWVEKVLEHWANRGTNVWRKYMRTYIVSADMLCLSAQPACMQASHRFYKQVSTLSLIWLSLPSNHLAHNHNQLSTILTWLK